MQTRNGFTLLYFDHAGEWHVLRRGGMSVYTSRYYLDAYSAFMRLSQAADRA